MSYVRLINQCGLYVDKIKIFLKIRGCGLYTGALNRPKITVSFLSQNKQNENDTEVSRLDYLDININLTMTS